MADFKINNSDINFNLLANNSIVGIIQILPSGKFCFANSSFCNLVGYTNTELYNIKFQTIINPNDSETNSNFFNLFNDSNNFSIKTEKNLITKHGDKIWCEICLNAYVNENQDIEYAVGIVNNINKFRTIEENLKENEEKYRAAYQTSPDAVNINKLNGVYIDINDGFTKLTGYTREDVIGKSSIEINIWAIPHDRDKLINELKKNGVIYNLETEFRFKNGTIHTGLVSASIIKLNNEPHILSVTRDISDRKRAEQILKISEEQMRMLLDLASDAFFRSNSNGNLIQINNAAIQLTGYSSAELLSMNIQNLFSNEQLFELPPRFDLLEIGDTIKIERKIIRKDGSTAIIEMNSKKMPDNTYQSFFRNITERKLTDEALKLSEARLRSLLDTFPYLVWLKDLEGKFLSVNQPFVDAFNQKSVDDVIGKTDFDITDKEFAQKYVTDDKFVITNLKKINTEEEIIDNKQRKWFETHKTPVFDINGNVIGTAGFARDITDRKNMELDLIAAKEKAEESDRLKSAFLANMSHEIRTPMNAIKGFSQLLDDDELSKDKRNKYVKVINQRTDDLLTLINDLLDIAKIEAGQLPIILKPDNINNLLSEIYIFFKSHLESNNIKNVSILCNNLLENNESFVWLDFFRVRQVLINLINNALKFTNNGHILFGCKFAQNNLIQFFVEDTGVGIPDNMENIIFEPFRQIHESYLSKNKGGTGLGLSIVKGLVELMNGEVWYESKFGEGSTFYFTLPYQPSDIIVKKENAHAAGSFNWSNKTILIIEDDDFNAQLLIEFLSKTNVKYLYAPNGEKALVLLNQNPDINLILIDIQLPDINGYDLTRQIKEILPNVIVIAQTAYAAEGDRAKAIECGCIDYISKPINRMYLLKIIQRYFE